MATAAIPASTAAARGRGAAAGAGAAAAGRWPAGGGLVAVADVAGAGGAGAAWAVHIQAVAAGVGIAHGVVVGVGAAVLRDGRFQIAQVGVAGGEGAELGVVVPCAQVLQAGLRGVLLAVVGEDPALPRFTLQQVDGSNMLFVFYHIVGRIGELSQVIAKDVVKLLDRRGFECHGDV